MASEEGESIKTYSSPVARSTSRLSFLLWHRPSNYPCHNRLTVTICNNQDQTTPSRGQQAMPSCFPSPLAAPLGTPSLVLIWIEYPSSPARFLRQDEGGSVFLYLLTLSNGGEVVVIERQLRPVHFVKICHDFLKHFLKWIWQICLFILSMGIMYFSFGIKTLFTGLDNMSSPCTCQYNLR